jgi:pimeloyl-ACP methyl ester carboxylesterase
LELDYLLRALDYLGSAQIRPSLLKDIEKVKIIHGECDAVAPLAEARDIQKALPRSRFISVKGAGHIPFLKQDFAV